MSLFLLQRIQRRQAARSKHTAISTRRQRPGRSTSSSITQAIRRLYSIVPYQETPRGRAVCRTADSLGRKLDVRNSGASRGSRLVGGGRHPLKIHWKTL
eukprot:scaffold1785_cov247-Pinguiococcus_pyrenoidosus.AAC.5